LRALLSSSDFVEVEKLTPILGWALLEAPGSSLRCWCVKIARLL
jgi:hypothetical protein